MAREILKKAGAGASEGAIRALMPELQQTLLDIQMQIRQLDAKMEQRLEHFQRDMVDKFDRTRSEINELGNRMSRVEGKLEAYLDTIQHQSIKMENWIERIVKMETLQELAESGRSKG